MAAHSITDLVERYEAVGGTWETIAKIAGVRGPRAEAEALGNRTVTEVERLVEAAEAAHATQVRRNQVTFYKRDGEWFAKGRADILVVGEVTITKRSGDTVRRTVSELTPSFSEGGVEMVYGRLAPTEPPARRTVVSADAHTSYQQDGAHYHADASGRTITYDYS